MKRLLILFTIGLFCQTGISQASMAINPENRNNMAAAKPGEVNPLLPVAYQSANLSDSLGRGQLVNYISATQKMQPALVAHLADSICKAHGVVIFSKENKPVDLKKASEAGELQANWY